MSAPSQLRVLGESPLNADPPDPAILIKHHLTPSELMYCRNHCKICATEGPSNTHTVTGDIPKLDESKFTIRIDGMVQQETQLSLSDMKAKYKPRSVVAALQVGTDPLLSVGVADPQY